MPMCTEPVKKEDEGVLIFGPRMVHRVPLLLSGSPRRFAMNCWSVRRAGRALSVDVDRNAVSGGETDAIVDAVSSEAARTTTSMSSR
jgi:hypothetical protein